MTDNQMKQMMDIMTKCVNSIQRLDEKFNGLQTDVSELKTNVSELKEGQQRIEMGQARLEKELLTTNRALDTLAGESIRVRARVEVLEQLSN